MLVCTYEFGRCQGAEGICTERFVKAMLLQSWRVTVVTSGFAGSDLSHDLVRVLLFSDRPGTVRVAKYLEDKFGYYLEPGLLWRLRLRMARFDQLPDFIYGRGMPFSGLLAAAALANRLHKPFGIHLSDPFPSPWDQRDRIFRSKRAAVSQIINQCSFVTFVTEEAQRYVQELLGISLESKAFVLPHIAPEPVWFESPPGKRVFLYAGRFYGRRRPDQLLDGFRMLLQDCPFAEFHYVGPDHEWIQNLANEYKIENAVKVHPYTEQVKEYYSNAEVLVATDANDANPVFLTTKIIEYLNTNRKVLLVSPDNSPGSRLADQFPSTAYHTPEEPSVICQAMKQLLESHPSNDDFSFRFSQMTAFSPGAIAQRFIAGIHGRL